MPDQVCDVTGCLEPAVWTGTRGNESVALCFPHFKNVLLPQVQQADRADLLSTAAISRPVEPGDVWVWDVDATALPLAEDTVACECSPEANPGCVLGAHREGHSVEAHWRVSEGDHEDDFVYLCNQCAEAAVARIASTGRVFRLLEQAGGRA